MSAKNNTEPKPVKCKLDKEDCISLSDILESFNGPINEEHAWALCYQCAKCFKNAYSKNADKCRLVKKLEQVILSKEGCVNSKSIICDDRLQDTNVSGKYAITIGIDFLENFKIAHLSTHLSVQIPFYIYVKVSS